MNTTTENAPQGRLIKQVVTHTGPHTDEAAGMALLLENIPGAKARLDPDHIVSFVDTGRCVTFAPGQQPDDVIAIGVLGGDADEHNDCDAEECSAMKVARILGVEENLAVKIFLDRILRMDKTAPNAGMVNHRMIRIARHSGYTDAQVFEWGILAARAMYRAAVAAVREYEDAMLAFSAGTGRKPVEPRVTGNLEAVSFWVHTHFREEFATWAEASELAEIGYREKQAQADAEIRAGNGKAENVNGYLLVSIASANDEIANRSRELLKHDFIVVSRPTGHIQILVAGNADGKGRRVNLAPLLGRLRGTEASARVTAGESLRPLLDKEFWQSGSPEGHPWWFGQRADDYGNIGMVLNGTVDAARGVEPTVLGAPTVVSIVREFLKWLPAKNAPEVPRGQRRDERRRSHAPKGNGRRPEGRPNSDRGPAEIAVRHGKPTVTSGPHGHRHSSQKPKQEQRQQQKSQTPPIRDERTKAKAVPPINLGPNTGLDGLEAALKAMK